MFSKKIQLSGTAPEMDDDFIAHQFALYRMCGMDDTVYNYYDKRTQCLPRALSAVLINIDEFAGVREHFEWISRNRIRGLDDTVFNACIKDLRECGLLITKHEALSKLRPAQSIKRTGTLSMASWITKERPDSLLRSIRSFTANFKKYGHTIDIFVSDDSTDEGKSEELSNRLATRSREDAIPMTYMGHRERRKLRDTILDKGSADGLPAHILDFALFGLEGVSPSHGANRNAVLLANAGEMILCTDDDVYCDLRLPENDGYDLEIATRINPDIRESFPDRHTLEKIHPAVTDDIFTYHDRLLGRHTSELLGDFKENNKIKLKNLSSKDLDLLLGNGGVIKTTIAGSAGDSGMVSPHYLLWLRGKSRELYTASESVFKESYNSREFFQASSHFGVGYGSYFLGMNMGLDNREILPPFFPILRGEDTIFSRMIGVVAENALIGTVPVAITHTPVNQRSYEENMFLDHRPEMCEVFMMLLGAHRYPAGCAISSSRIESLGSHLTGIGSLPLEEFEEYVKQLWLTRVMNITNDIESLLTEYDYKPAYWADLLEKFIISIKNYSYTNYITAIRDLYTGDERMAAMSCRDIFRHYGELLKWWPVIFNAAKDIRGNK